MGRPEDRDQVIVSKPRAVYTIDISFDDGASWTKTKIACATLRKLVGDDRLLPTWFEME